MDSGGAQKTGSPPARAGIARPAPAQARRLFPSARSAISAVKFPRFSVRPRRVALAASLAALCVVAGRPAPAADGPRGGGPNLAVEAADIVLPKPSLLLGHPVTLEITIRNVGGAEARNFQVGVWDLVGTQGKILRAFQVASLPAQASAVLSHEWKPEGSGVHRITVRVDPDGKVPDANRANNTASREVVVLSEAEATANLYAFAVGYTRPDSLERRLVEAEHHVLVDAKKPAAFDALLNVAVDRETRSIVVVGLGLRPWYVVSNVAAAAGARRGARLDAQHWISLIRTGKAVGPSKGQVYGAEVLFEQELPDGSYLVKMKAPLF